MSRPRDAIRCAPLDSSIFGSLLLPGMPKSLEPVALLYRESYYKPDSVLAVVRSTGLMVAWHQGVIMSVDQRKAQAALDAMRTHPRSSDEARAEMAETLKAWRAAADMTQARAAEVLGMSKRTYEAIEAGRGFNYPVLLHLALRAFGEPEPQRD